MRADRWCHIRVTGRRCRTPAPRDRTSDADGRRHLAEPARNVVALAVDGVRAKLA